MMTVIGETFWLLSESVPKRKDLEMLAGSWVHVVQFRRPLMAAVSDLWSVIMGDIVTERRWEALANDFLKLLALAPLAASHWAQDVDEVVTCSDASEHGGGVCRSEGLTELGLMRLSEAGKLRETAPSDGLVLVDAFAGISAARRALQLLGISSGSHVTYETHPAAVEVVRMAFQNVRELGDIRETT